MNYRAEIDGLRAIAVVSVILYHAKIVIFGRDWFEGGFIGVDIFFVISGYLITRIILTELEHTNTFSFINFYERRARRILPMLLVVIAVCIPFAWQRLLPLDLIDFAKSALSAIGFASNFFFYFSTTEYGADSALLKPLLHTWSLGVEEQFYIIVPIIILLIWKFSRASMLTIFVGMLIISIQFADFMEARNSELNFFLPFSRFWELLVGSSLAFIELKYGRTKNPIFTQTLPIIGLFLITHSILFFDAQTPHPSFQTLIPILGVALVLAFCSAEDFVGKILSFKPIVGIGLISYSLYLWHFPIFAFGRMSSSSPSTYDKVEWIILAFVLSIISYFLVEKTFRNTDQIKTTLFNTSVLVCLFFLVATSSIIIKKEGFSERLSDHKSIFKELLSEPWHQLQDNQGRECFGSRDGLDFCTFTRKENDKNIILVGDSIMASLSSEFTSLFLQNGFNVTVMTSSACFFVPHSSQYKNDGSKRIIPKQNCDEAYQMRRLDNIIQSRDSIVILGGNLQKLLGPDKVINFIGSNGLTTEENIENGISYLTSKGHKIYLVYPHPLPKVNVSKYVLSVLDNVDILVKKENIVRDVSNGLEISYKEYLEETKIVYSFYETLKKYNVGSIFPHEIMCNNMRCRFVEGNNLLVVDEGHISNYFAKKLSVLILEEIRKELSDYH